MTLAKSLKLIPKLSEKSVALASNSEYIFLVPRSASKALIAQAVEAQYSVKVGGVRTAIIKGKTKRSVQRRNAPKMGQRKDHKRAYVSVTEGKIDILGEN